jgi:hypothetical protein
MAATVALRGDSDLVLDIIEGANQDIQNHMTLHSSVNCTIAGAAMSGKLQRSDCAYYPGYNAGCGILSNNNVSYGKPFNDNGGGELSFMSSMFLANG